MWHFTASEKVVPLTTEESPESKSNKKILLEGYWRMEVYSINPFVRTQLNGRISQLFKKLFYRPLSTRINRL